MTDRFDSLPLHDEAQIDPAPRKPLILLVDDEAEVRVVYRSLLERAGVYRLLEASDAVQGFTLARQHQPDLVISDLVMPGSPDGIAFCAQLKADPALAGTMFMLLTGHAETERRTAGMLIGVDDFVAKPVESAELLARTRALLRHKAAHDQLKAEHRELEQAKAHLARSFDELLDLLGHLLDVARPGAGERSQRLADAAEAVGTRCDVPEHFRREMVIAARLAPLAELAPHDGAVRAGGRPEAWRGMVGLQAVLGRVAQLAPVGDLLGAVYENWDGTGQPGHAQKGQIPMRSRILRTLLEYFALRDAGMDIAAAGEQLQQAAGTKLDPACVAQVNAWARDGGAVPADRTFVAVDALTPGMVLADDLFTASGTMLLKTGAAITDATLGIIQRRHLNDPILVGPYIKR
jgi:response regulator RpfG family c-di-GMP phosphodiesterase